MSIAASGTQHVLRAGEYQAVIASVGATLRSLSFDGRDLVVPFEADEVRPVYRGATLAPWPNRVVDGRYRFAGVEYELALNERQRSHALHGLVAWTDFTATDKGPSHLTLQATIEPQSGYPWRVVVETSFALTSDGLAQRVSARNDSATPAPWGTGAHPYLRAGGGTVDEWMLHLPASRVLTSTPDRLVPIELVDVETDAERFDFRSPRLIGAAEIDHAFTSLDRDAEGVATVRLTVADGSGVALSWDAACPWAQVYTADMPDGAADPAHRRGVAVEPQTAAPDAFNADRYDFDAGLLVLEPGVWSPAAAWSIRAVGSPRLVGG